MKMNDEQVIKGHRETVWLALLNLEVLKEYVPGT